MKETLRDILIGVMPTVVICSVIAITLRITYLIKHRQKPKIIKELFSLTFLVYILCLFYVVTFQDIDGSWATSNFSPFREMFRYEIGSRLFIKNVLGNMLMFVPYGFFSSYFLKEKKTLIIMLLTLIVSFTIEYIQLQIGRVFDIDDIILNVLGGMVGSFIYLVLVKLGNIFNKKDEER